MTDLWCLHVIGPDDCHPAPSKAEAERAAAFLSENYAADEDRGVPIAFEAAPWPYTLESHAEDVGLFYVFLGMAPPEDAVTMCQNCTRAPATGHVGVEPGRSLLLCDRCREAFVRERGATQKSEHLSTKGE